MSFNNVYYKRAVGTAKACYVCYKPTTTVLATINATDFLYTCPGHLIDRSFATILGKTKDGEKKAEVTEEEIAKIREEWEEKQRRKKEKEKEKEKEEKEAEVDQGKEKGKDLEAKRNIVKEAANESKSTTVPHERYALHRDFFAMRQAEHRRQRRQLEATDTQLAPRLPSAPGTTPEQKY